MTDSTAVVIREAGTADVPALIDLLNHGSLVEGKEDVADLANYERALDEISLAPNDTVLVACRNGEIVGMCQLIVFRHFQSHGGLCAEIESVHVHPEQRSQGIGGVLIREAIAQARALGCYRVQLMSNKQRTDAHRFYAREGFVASHEGYKLLLDP